MTSAVTAVTEKDDDGIKPSPKILAISSAVTTVVRIAQFRGTPMLLKTSPYPHFTPLDFEAFKYHAYPLVGAVTHSNVRDAWEYLKHTVEDLTPYENQVLFGVEPEQATITAETDIEFLHAHRPVVWDMARVARDITADRSLPVWRSPYAPVATTEPIPFILQLACGDVDMYHDIMLSLAPIIMGQKPDGVIWWVGAGANGKSTLMDALYAIFPDQLTSMNVKQITEDKDLPSLNGYLANVVRESSEGRIDNTENYKSLGTHENFKVHKFHAQSMATINANIHHIFSANEIPVFNDKGHSARRRTHIIPFNAEFASDPTFKQRTFTPLFFGQLISEMCKYAAIIKQAGYKYQWKSTITTGSKAEYDEDVNSAEAYLRAIIRQGVTAFDNYRSLGIDYENWCLDNGFNKLGVKTLRESAKRAGFIRGSLRIGEKIEKPYMLGVINGAELQSLGMGRPGLYTTLGYQYEEPAPVTVPPFNEQAEKDELGKRLNGEW